MRLLIVSQYWPPEINGRSLAMAKQVAALVEAGIACDVICAEPTFASDELGYLETGASEVRTLKLALGAWRQRGTRLYELGRTFAGADMASWLWAAKARRTALQMARRTRYDAVVSSTLPYQSCFPAYAVASRLGVPWVCGIYDPPRSLFPPPYEAATRRLQRLLEGPKIRAIRRIARQADALVLPSRRLGRYLRETMGLDLSDREHVLPAVGWKTLEPGHGEPGVVELQHTGVLFRRASPRFLSVLRTVVDEEQAQGVRVRLRQVGETPARDVAVVRDAGLESAFVAHGAVPYLESLRLMSQAAALLILDADTEDGIFLPSKLADYAASGRPVLMWSPPGGPVAELVGGFEHPGFMGQTEEGALRVLRAFMEDVREGRDMGRWALDAHRHSAAGVAQTFRGVLETAIEYRAGRAQAQ